MVTCDIMYEVEVAGRFHLSNIVSPSERPATSTLDGTNWWADLFGDNTMDTKVCSKCGKEKSTSEFCKRKLGKDGLDPRCKDCYRIYRKQYYDNNKEKVLSRVKKWRELNGDKLKQYQEKYLSSHKEQRLWQWKLYDHGITKDEYEDKYNEQNGCCAICGTHGELGKLAVDHNHSTNNIRGLLCKTCNQGLGLFYESINSLESAIEYLNKWRE